jgi:hypothetical protein
LNSQLAIHRRQGQSLKSPLADAFPEVLHASCPRVQRAFSSSSSAFPQCNDLQRSHLAALDPFPSFLLHNYSPRHCPAPFNSRSMRCVGNGQGQLCRWGGRSCQVNITGVFFFFFFFLVRESRLCRSMMACIVQPECHCVRYAERSLDGPRRRDFCGLWFAGTGT